MVGDRLPEPAENRSEKAQNPCAESAGRARLHDGRPAQSMQRRSRLALSVAAFGVLAVPGSSEPVMPPGFISASEWAKDDPAHGGFSALSVSADGLRFTAIADRSTWVEGQFQRDAGGQITGIVVDRRGALHQPDGTLFPDTDNDSEGLAITGDGLAYISFERQARVMVFAGLDQPAMTLPQHPDFASFGTNTGLEALASDAAGRLYTLPEKAPEKGQTLPLYRSAAAGWEHAFDIPEAAGFRPVGADFGPDGLFYLLERQFVFPFGFASQVRRFALPGEGQNLPEAQLVFASPPGLHDNLEGLSVWRDTVGDIRLTMISDNNFLSLQRTEIVEYRAAP
jgi:hypothetical protein